VDWRLGLELRESRESRPRAKLQRSRGTSCPSSGMSRGARGCPVPSRQGREAGALRVHFVRRPDTRNAFARSGSPTCSPIAGPRERHRCGASPCDPRCSPRYGCGWSHGRWIVSRSCRPCSTCRRARPRGGRRRLGARAAASLAAGAAACGWPQPSVRERSRVRCRRARLSVAQEGDTVLTHAVRPCAGNSLWSRGFAGRALRHGSLSVSTATRTSIDDAARAEFAAARRTGNYEVAIVYAGEAVVACGASSFGVLHCPRAREGAEEILRTPQRRFLRSTRPECARRGCRTHARLPRRPHAMRAPTRDPPYTLRAWDDSSGHGDLPRATVRFCTNRHVCPGWLSAVRHYLPQCSSSHVTTQISRSSHS